MANEIIELFEYLTNNSIVKGFAIGYMVVTLIVIALAISIFVFVFKQIKSMKDRW